MMKRIIALALCLVFLVSTSVIPSSAQNFCPNGHVTGLRHVDHIDEYGPNDDYCSYLHIVWIWTCCQAEEIEDFYVYHNFVMTGASYMTCTKCGYGKPAK